MPIEGFDPKAFAADLAKQAGELIPQDIQGEDRKYIVNIVNNFCVISGDAISKDAKLNFDANQAILVTQFIAEWAFHKSIDMIRSGIPPQLRDAILQKIAFSIFENAKLAIIKKIPDDKMAPLIEHHVKKTYEAEINALQQKGALSEEQANNAKTKSNIDEMEKQESANIAKISDTKILKLATFAMLLKKLPTKKVNEIFEKLDKNDVQYLMEYMKMENLEYRIDQKIIMKSLGEIRHILPEPKEINVSKLLKKFDYYKENTSKQVLKEIVSEERSNIQNFLLERKFPALTTFSPQLIELITEHIEEKINDYKKKIQQNN